MKRALNLRNTVKSATLLGMVASLLASLAWSVLPRTTFAEETKVLADQEFFTKRSFIAYAGPWSTYFGAGKSLKHGVDFLDEIAVRPDSFPSNAKVRGSVDG